jgi:uncharacterized damage-inducible protein DinB
MNEDLRSFYGLVRRTRSGVFDWLETLPTDVVVEERPDFAFGSIGSIYAHVADCYHWWVGTAGLGYDRLEVQEQGVPALRKAFDRVDAVVAEALAKFTHLDEPLPWTSPEGYQEVLSRRWLILHPITHEFHHKGQALALARVLGHPNPGRPDTDLVSP